MIVRGLKRIFSAVPFLETGLFIRIRKETPMKKPSHNGNALRFCESPTDRRLAIRDYISEVRRTSISRIAYDFGVSRITVIRDLQALSDPGIIVLRGRNRDSVLAADGWYSNYKLFKPSQEAFFRDLYSRLNDEEDKRKMQSILKDYTPHVNGFPVRTRNDDHKKKSGGS